jgi:hypothetical protein
MIKQGAKTIQEMAGGRELSTAGAYRPWEDRSLSAQERHKSYKTVVQSNVERILELSKCEGITLQERKALMKDPDTQFWAHEQKLLLNETAEQFCERIDREAIPEIMGKNFLGAKAWEEGFGVTVGTPPPYPVWLTRELLEEECQLHPGEQVKDTHVLVLMPKTVNGEPYSAAKLSELCASKKGSGNRLIYYEGWQSESWADTPQVESEWVLLPKSDPVPEKMKEGYPSDGESRHFRSKNISAQEDVHKNHYSKDYREAKAVEVMTAALLNDVVHGEPRMLDDWNYLRCVEPNSSGRRVLVGYFAARGLRVDVVHDYHDNDHVGRALARKSKS